MSLFSGILQSQAPAKQDATSAIHTLCLRLTSSSLVEDRRAAALSLRSFAREYKELVASGGLRGLINTLSKDSEDVETAKVVLETLRMLFVRDETNPESSDDIALWLADEFTQKQENLTILIDLLENPDFYTRLYTLQLLRDILDNRPERTQECVFSAPLGISRLASILEDQRDAIRNEAILLLIHLTNGHQDVQKVVAFESAYERIFTIIDVEGGIDGGIIVQDCLQLLTNLLTHNASNQTLFRETGYVPRLNKLFKVEGEAPPYAVEKRNTNLIMALGVCRAFVAPGGHNTPANQQAFFTNGILGQILDHAFSGDNDLEVRAEALRACADTIHGNALLQQNFAQLQVNYVNPSVLDTQAPRNGGQTVFVIDGLLGQALLNNTIQAFNLRLAACQCLESYFFNNTPIKLHFLRRAIDGYTSGEDSTTSILACLMDMDSDVRSDPYRIWVAAVLFLHLISDSDEAKEIALSVVLGDEEEGEEVVTAIQTIAANLITCLEHNYDPRISIAYLMVLCTWLYEDTAAVDDFLQEGATVQTLVAAVIQSTNADSLVQGLCVYLLGILYEFSTTESPVPRATLHTILISRLGRDQYVNRLSRLRENPVVRDFEATVQVQQHHQGKRGLPELYFDHVFIDFLKDNYSRVFRTIDKDPGQKTHYKLGSDGTPNGISLELVDSLKAQIEDKEEALSKLQASNLTLEKRFAQEQQDFKKYKETSVLEMRKLHEQTEAMKKHYESNADAMKKHYETNAIAADKQFQLTKLQLENRVARVQQEGEGVVKDLKAQLEKMRKEGEENLKRQKAHGELEVKRAKHLGEAEVAKTRQEAENHMRKMDEDFRRELARIHGEAEAAIQRITGESRKEVERVRSELEEKLAEEKRRAEVEVLQARDGASQEVYKAREQMGAVIKMLEDRVGELEGDLDRAAKDHSTELAAAKRQLANEREEAVREVREQLEKQIAEKLEAAKKESEAAIEKAKAEARKDAEEQAKKDAEEKIKKAEKDAQDKISANNATNAEKLKSAEEAARKASEEKEKLEKELAEVREKAKKDLAEAQEKAKSSGGQSDEEKEKAKKDLAAAEEETKKAQAQAKSVQAELDDLLLVLGDIEDKKKGYKKRLKALNETVSEDEGDDDDDDDDDDDEEGEEEEEEEE